MAELASKAQELRGDLSREIDTRKAACTHTEELKQGLAQEQERVAALRKEVEELSFQLL
jgi:hypothetical protein